MEKRQEDSKNYQRFHVLHRLLHIIIIVNFTSLTITGFMLRLSHFEWVKALTALLGGVAVTGGIHRFCASFFYIGVIIHLIWLCYYKFILKGSLTGQDSLLPARKDLTDIYKNLRYIFGRGTPPLFDRFSYLQKVDYWAVMLGMQSMGITRLDNVAP